MPIAIDTARGVHLGILVVALAALLIAALAATGAAGPLVAFLTACPHKALTHAPCPLCGATSAATLLLSGDVTDALSRNPLSIVLAAAGFAQIAYRTVRVVRPRLVLREEVAINGACLALLICAATVA
ncbi:MAG: DUF2752 domain-containing protein [Deltaproteobacteria bacterium]|nr:DUF2752 domain-containing protein [Deltaproteobacteria bacterium]